MLKALIDGTEIDLNLDGNGMPVTTDGKNADILTIQAGKSYHLLLHNKSYFVEIQAFDKSSKKCVLKINNKTVAVHFKDRYDLLLHILGIDNKTGNFINSIKAPMPGLVIKILVSAGQQISKGEPVVLLEAMKMENVIKSPGDGTVKAIMVNEKSAVDKNQVLVELE